MILNDIGQTKVTMDPVDILKTVDQHKKMKVRHIKMIEVHQVVNQTKLVIVL